MWACVGAVVTVRSPATSSARTPSAVTQEMVGGGVAAAEHVRETPRVLGKDTFGGGSSSRRGPSLRPQHPGEEGGGVIITGKERISVMRKSKGSQSQ